VQSRRRHIEPGTFASVIRDYMTSPKYLGLAYNTKASYGHFLAIAELPETLGALSVEVIRPALVQAFLDGFSDRPASQRNARAALKAVEKWAIVRDRLPWPITFGTEAPGGGGGHEPWSDEQVAIAEAHAGHNLSRAVTLGANTGQRGSDLVTMRWTDLETYEGRLGINVTQKKTGLKIWIPFTQELQRAIATWERRPGFILLRMDGSPWERGELSDQWWRERKDNPELALLKDRVFHGLRGTACVRLLRAGANTRQIADMVGMSEPMVKRYTRFAEQRKNALAAVIHLDTRQPVVNPLKSRDTK
jgi:integrase